jgi:SOS-response transcriptional repressor LexA
MSNALDLDKFYYVRMSDDSMRGVGIRKGDTLKLRRSATFWSGDLIAAETPRGLLAVFAYHEKGGLVTLRGAHPRCPVRTYPRRAIKVLGVHHREEDEGDPKVEELVWPEFI